jgi:copper chaperone CopZ
MRTKGLDKGRIVKTTLVAALMIIAVASGATGAEPKHGEGLRRTVLTVKGMMCRSCSGAVEQSIRKIPGVTNVAVDTGGGTVDVTYGVKVTPEALREAVRKAGYQAEIRPPAPPQR